RQRIRYPARQHAFWSSGATGVRHVFYRLFSISLGDREDAATNVCRRLAWRLRPAARFLDPAYRHNVLRAVSPAPAKTCSGGAGEAYLTRYPASRRLHAHADSPPQLPRPRLTVVSAIEPNGAACRFVEPVQQPQEECFSRSAVAYYGENFATLHLDGDFVHKNF